LKGLTYKKILKLTWSFE